MSALGIRSNNPLNLRPGSYNGEVGMNEKGFSIFDTMENGVRAAAKNLIAYQDKHGIDTVEGVVRRWSTTDQDAYIAFVCHVCELNHNDPLDLHDFNTLWWLVESMGEMENGHDEMAAGVTDAQLSAGVKAALGIVDDPGVFL
jgi:hypothetical protein